MAVVAKLDMVGIATRDLAASLAFYRLLGLPVPLGAEQEGPHVEVNLGGLRFAWDTIEIVAGVYDGWEEPVGQRIELAFHCDTAAGVDEVYARLTGVGHRGHKPPWDAFWGQRYAIVTDPDGNLVSLFAQATARVAPVTGLAGAIPM